MWSWISNTVERNARFITQDKERQEDLISDTLMYLCENKSVADKIFEQKSVTYLIKVMKGVCNNQTIKENFGDCGTWQSQYYNDYLKIKEASIKYNISLIEQNAYKFFALCGLRSVLYTQNLLRSLIKVSIVPLEEIILDTAYYDACTKGM